MNKTKRLIALLLSLVMLCALLSGCGGSSSDSKTEEPAAESGETQEPAAEEGGEEAEEAEEPEAPASTMNTVIVRETGDPKTWNPTYQSDDNLYSIAQNVYVRLTCLDHTKTVIPEAAESWDVTDEGMTITFHLKDGQKWWDGEALTADDVKYTFDYVKEHPETYFSSSMDIVDTIEVIDPLTVVFHMNTADVSFVARLGWYGTFILPQHIFDNGQPWEDNPASTDPMQVVGCGPFKIESYTQGSNTTLVANEDYYAGAPKIDRLIFSIIPDDATAVQAMLNGEVDYMQTFPSNSVSQMLGNPDFNMVPDTYPSPYRIIFNMNDPIIGDLAVRQAIALCINREEVSEKAYAGIMPPEYSAYPSVVSWCSNTEDTYPKQDIEAAKQVLEDAGYTQDENGFYVTGIVWDVFEGMQDMANLIIASCAEAGIEITMNLSEYNAWSQKVGQERNFMMESQGGFMGPDPAALATRLGTGSNSNYGAWSNAEFDRLCAEAAATGDTEKRAELYKAAQKIIVEELPMINVVGYADYTAIVSNLHGTPDEGEGQWSWEDWSHAYFD